MTKSYTTSASVWSIVRAGSAFVGQLTSRAGTPATVQPDGTAFSTTEPDATLA